MLPRYGAGCRQALTQQLLSDRARRLFTALLRALLGMGPLLCQYQTSYATCTKWTSGVEDYFSTARDMGDLLWGTLKPGLVLRGLY